MAISGRNLRKDAKTQRLFFERHQASATGKQAFLPAHLSADRGLHPLTADQFIAVPFFTVSRNHISLIGFFLCLFVPFCGYFLGLARASRGK